MWRKRGRKWARWFGVGIMLVVLIAGRAAPVGATPPAVTFAAHQDIATYPYANAVAVADFNGDGKPDFVTANGAESFGKASVLLNTTATGAATASFATHADFTTGLNASGVAVADFNGDGKPDIVTANRSDNNVSVLLNTTATGATAASFATAVNVPASSGPYSVAVGDINGDGKPDIIVANSGANTVSVLLNTTPTNATAPTFASAANFAVAAGAYGPFGVAVGDVNGDGKVDIVTSGYSNGNVSVLLNTTTTGASTPTFASHVDFTVGSQPLGVTLGDVNGDGKPDIMAANDGAGTVSVLLNTTATGATTPTFASHVDFTAPVAAAVTIADVNGDGVPDLLVASAESTNAVSVLLNTTATNATTPSFASYAAFGAYLNPLGIAVGDFNGDGRLDVVTANGESGGTASVLLNTSGLTLTASGGNNGSVAVGSAFASLVVHVTDSTGAAISGVQVTFTAPTTGARGTFAGGANTATVTTDGSGNATAPAFTAGTTAGSFTVTASVPSGGSYAGTARFTLTVTPGPAASVTAVAGNNQNITVGAAATTALQAKVTDSYGNARVGDTVTFTVNAASGAGATFPMSATTATATTDNTGIATAPALTANTVAGGYTVTASDGAATSATFHLTNVAGVATGFALSGLTNAVAGTVQTLTVFAVDQYGNTATTYTGPVNFTSSDAQAGLPPSSSLTNGTGSFPITLKTAGSQTVSVTGSGGISGQSSVTITAGSAAHITAVTGSGQGATTNSRFGTNLRAKVTDSDGNAVSGATVTFTAPMSGASGSFAPGNSGSATATTDSNGIAIAPTLDSNGTTGAFGVTARVMGVGETANFALTVGPATMQPTPHSAATTMGTPNADPTRHTAAQTTMPTPKPQPTPHP